MGACRLESKASSDSDMVSLLLKTMCFSLLGTRSCPLLAELTRKKDQAQCAPIPLTMPAPQLVSLYCQERGWSTFCRVWGGGDDDGSAFVPVSSGRLAPEPKPRQPASHPAA